MSNHPQDVANEALDACGLSEMVIGDLEEGTLQAQILLRKYWTCLRALLRGALWDFARRQTPLILLADASGQTAGVDALVPQGQYQYCYQYPSDCARVRYIPWQPFVGPGAPQGNIVPPNPQLPIMPGLNNSPLQGQRIRPARFLITSDPNHPAPQGAQTNLVQGESPIGNTVILTNVPQAQIIYTYYAIYPSTWDMLFRQAMVAYLASEVALPLWVKKGDNKMGMSMRDSNIAILKSKVAEARIVDGNESVATNDLSVDWIRTRNSGYGRWGGWNGGGWGDGDGGYGGGWDSMGLSSGATF